MSKNIVKNLCSFPHTLWINSIFSFITVPCGQCSDCRLAKKR